MNSKKRKLFFMSDLILFKNSSISIYLKSLVLKVFLVGFALMLFGEVIQPVHAEGFNNIRFKEKMWDGRVLRIFMEGPSYLKAELEFDIAPPPLNASKITIKELEILHQYAKENRTDEQVLKIKREATGEFVNMFIAAPVIHDNLAKVSHDILKFADEECQYFVVKYKKRFARARPSQLAPDLKLVVPNPGHAAYPSGHATQSMLSAMILGAIDPLNKAIYIQYAKDIAQRREIAGVHYPSDSAAGQKLAGGILVALMKLPDFKQNLTKAVLEFNTLKNR